MRIIMYINIVGLIKCTINLKSRRDAMVIRKEPLKKEPLLNAKLQKEPLLSAK